MPRSSFPLSLIQMLRSGRYQTQSGLAAPLRPLSGDPYFSVCADGTSLSDHVGLASHLGPAITIYPQFLPAPLLPVGHEEKNKARMQPSANTSHHLCVCPAQFQRFQVYCEGVSEAAGGSVKVYLYTYHSVGDANFSQQHDDRLVRVLRRVRYNFSRYLTTARIRIREKDEDTGILNWDVERDENALIMDSLMKVLELVLQEKSTDAVMLTRVDRRRRDPRTLANVRWNVTDVAQREGVNSLKREKRPYDPFFALPIKHVELFIPVFEDVAVNIFNSMPIRARCFRL
ncbi:unnamed protein product [Prorocentrum cordatum]|uniref:Uncharacterized protein n=1 Tax=Prorocentrum cordatum TaxID=2364126 RepID=A0ABN9V624_9DINO|nr:unnamed protein product [Polarella glacialis]